MQYTVLMGDRSRQVTVSQTAAGGYKVSLDGRSVAVDACSVSDTGALGDAALSLLIDGRSHLVHLRHQGDTTVHLSLRGRRAAVEVLDARRLQLRQAEAHSPAAPAAADIVAPMPGKVLTVLVALGDEVKVGQGVVVMEAMKMENELRASKAGIIRELPAKVGQTVESGALLCSIE
jgi:biotin carboxyl carrier protein